MNEEVDGEDRSSVNVQNIIGNEPFSRPLKNLHNKSHDLKKISGRHPQRKPVNLIQHRLVFED